MEDDILDYISPKDSTKLAKTSFWLFVTTITSIIVFGVLSATVNSPKVIDRSAMLLGLILLVLPIPGLILAIRSIRKSETSFWLKYIGLIGNGLTTIILISAIVVNIIDIRTQLY